jgi:ribonuclease HI
MTTIYTDGACSGNPGPGGWAWAVAPEGVPNDSGGEARSTNQRMEIMAVLEALRSNEGQLTIVSDSTYVVNCFRDQWYVKWKKNGWKNSQRQPVANKDLWEPLVELYLERKPDFRWVKGHSGDRMNDLVDQLAVAAAVVARDLPADAPAAAAHPPETLL